MKLSDFYFGNMTITRQFLSPGKTFTHIYKGIKWWLALTCQME